jgi:hypothetical protein
MIMKIFRFAVVLAVVGYAGWLAWPLISPFLQGAGTGAARAGAAVQSGGELFGFLPSWTLWAGAVALYLIAALMLGSGNARAAVAYFLGFLADAGLRLALDQPGGVEAGARSAGPTTMAAPEAFSSLPVDPIWLLFGGLILLGVLVLIASRRLRRRRTPGQFAY